MSINPNCALCFGRGWVLYPRMGGAMGAEACHYCARLPEAPADCDSKATSLEPGASEQDAKKGAGSTPDPWPDVSDAVKASWANPCVSKTMADSGAGSTPDETLRDIVRECGEFFTNIDDGQDSFNPPTARWCADLAQRCRALATPTKPADRITQEQLDEVMATTQPFTPEREAAVDRLYATPTKPEMQDGKGESQ